MDHADAALHGIVSAPERSWRKDLLNSALPLHLQVLTPGVFHANRYAVAPPVFYLNDNATLQAHATRVFNLKRPAIERAHAAGVFHSSRHDLAPMFFHLHHQVFEQTYAPARIFRERESG
jgi:hypothetical protein